MGKPEERGEGPLDELPGAEAERPRRPNRTTRETLRKSERGEGLVRFENAEALFRDLGI